MPDWSPEAGQISTSAQRTATAEAEAAIRQRRDTYAADEDRRALRDRLANATPAQIDNWVDSNITSLASARALFKAILKLIATD